MSQIAKFKNRLSACKTSLLNHEKNILNQGVSISIDSMNMYSEIEYSIMSEPFTEIHVIDGRYLKKVEVTSASFCSDSEKFKVEGTLISFERLDSMNSEFPEDQRVDIDKITNIIDDSKMSFSDVAFFLYKLSMVNQ